jgi:MFS family permease
MATPAAPLSLKTVFKQKSFRRLWLAQFVSIFGDFLALFGVISLITFRWHGTAVQVTAVSIAYMVPMAIIGPPAGVLVDRWNVKRVMIASDLIRAALIVLLVFVTDVRQICVIFLALSSVSSFFAPAQSVTLRTLVPKEGLMAANALMAQAFYTVRLLSPALAGAIVYWLTERATFYLDSASFFYSAIMVGTLAIVRPTVETREKNLKSLTADFLEGNKFIFTHSGLAFVFIAMALAMFVLAAFSPLISIYIRDALGAGPRMYGVISAMVGVGMIAGTQSVNRLARDRSKSHVVLTGLLGLGVATAILGLFHNIPMAAVSTFGIGCAIAFVWVPAQTMSQQETPPPMVGRVTSSFMSLISVSQVAGLALSGYLAQMLGVRKLFVACAVVLAFMAGVGYLLIRDKQPLGATAAKQV